MKTRIFLFALGLTFITAVGQAPALRAETFLLEDLEGAPRNGGVLTSFDKNSLGTEFNPDPFVISDGGSPASPGKAAHVFGKFGSNQAPWTWAQLIFNVAPGGAVADYSKWKSVSFWAKGDGGRVNIRLIRDAVKDHDHFGMGFEVPGEWTRFSLPIDKFSQNGWGKKLALDFSDLKQVSFECATHDSKFDFWIDQIEFSDEIVELKHKPYDTTGWIPWAGTDVARRRGTALDMSGLLDAPAGKHGWVKTKGEQFVFEDGTPARFWGINIVASGNFPSHEQAEETAELLAQMGVNMTRHHHYDAPWTNQNIFGKKGTTRTLDKDSMDRFDYFIAQLQKRGIYQYMDLLVHRKPYAADGVEDNGDVINGYKIEGEFDPTLIKLQEEFVRNFLGHKNPYTKKTYGKDPAMCLMEIINEDSLFYIQRKGDFSISSDYYAAVLAKQFGSWLINKYKTREMLEARWAPEEVNKEGLGSEEDPSKNTVDARVYFGDADYGKASKQRATDTMRFYYDLTMAYFNNMKSVVREMGSKAPVTGSNHWVSRPIDLYANARLDYIDRHDYWSHPNGGWELTTIRHDNTAMASNPGLGLIGGLASRRVKGSPYIVTEWQAAVPNDFRQDANFAMAAYGSFQDWHAIQFAFTHSNEAMDPKSQEGMAGLFDVLRQPSMMGIWPAAASIIHRGDVKRGGEGAWKVYSAGQTFDPDTQAGSPRTLGLVQRTGTHFSNKAAQVDLEAAAKAGEKDGWIVSSTEELAHNSSASIFTVNSPRSQGWSGKKQVEPVELANVTGMIDNSFATVVVTALEMKPLASSSRLLISALGNAVNTGMVRSATGDSIHKPGTGPVMAEPLAGFLSLTSLEGDLSTLKVYALDSSGKRGQEVPVVVEGDMATIEMQGRYQALHYEVVR